LPFYLAATLGLFCGAIFFALVSTKPVRIPGMATEAVDSPASSGRVLRH
jgi:hypothetical protein